MKRFERFLLPLQVLFLCGAAAAFFLPFKTAGINTDTLRQLMSGTSGNEAADLQRCLQQLQDHTFFIYKGINTLTGHGPAYDSTNLPACQASGGNFAPQAADAANANIGIQPLSIAVVLMMGGALVVGVVPWMWRRWVVVALVTGAIILVILDGGFMQNAITNAFGKNGGSQLQGADLLNINSGIGLLICEACLVLAGIAAGVAELRDRQSLTTGTLT